MKEIIVKCETCGSEFPAKNLRKRFCAECQKDRQKLQREKFHKKKRIEMLEKKYGNGQLVEDARAAKELGVSYGKYKAMQADGIV